MLDGRLVFFSIAYQLVNALVLLRTTLEPRNASLEDVIVVICTVVRVIRDHGRLSRIGVASST